MTKLSIIVLCIVILVATAPTALLAAPAQLSTTTKSALEKVISKADAKTGSSLRSEYSSLLQSQKLDQEWDRKIKARHDQNEADLVNLRKQIRLIDADKLNKLEAQLKQTKERYKPLFDRYTSLNKQIKAARLFNNKELNSILRTQADIMKIAVQLAREDVRSKEDLFKKAKDNKAKKVKQLRALLADIEPMKKKIKAERSRMNKSKQLFALEWKSFNTSIKKGNAKSVLNALTSLVVTANQINVYKQNLYAHEQTIQQTLLDVKNLMSRLSPSI